MERELKEQYIFNSIFLLANKLQLAGDNLCADITLKQFLLLNIIKTWPEGLPNMNDLAAILGCSRQNIKNIILALKNKGYIKVKDNSADKRATAIILSKKGTEYFNNNKEQSDHILKEIFQDIDYSDIEVFCSVMDKLFENVDSLITMNI